MNGRIELFMFKVPDAFDIHSRPLYRQISLLIPQSIVCQGIHVLALFPCAVKLDTSDIRRMDASALTGTGGYASVETERLQRKVTIGNDSSYLEIYGVLGDDNGLGSGSQSLS